MKKHKGKIQMGIVIGIFSSILITCLVSVFSQLYTENKEKEELTKELFSIFERENITTLLDIKKQKMIGIINLIKESKNMDDKSKNMFKDLLMIIIDEYSDNTKKIIKETVEEGKKMLKIK